MYIERIRTALDELESEIQSDSINTLEGVDYQDILWYYKSEENHRWDKKIPGNS